MKRSKALSTEAKAAILSMENADFPNVESFFRSYLIKKAEGQGERMAMDDCILLASIPDKDMRELVLLNRKVNGEFGAVVARAHNTRRCKEDHEAFMEGDDAMECVAYPDVDALAVKEIYQRELLRQRYLDEKLLMGKSVDVETKKKKATTTSYELLQETLKSLPRYARLPSDDDPFTANCNKSSATLLQAAADLTAAKQGRARASVRVKGVTKFNYGSEQRMCLWQPVDALKARVITLIRAPYTKLSSEELQELADQKEDVLQILDSLPESEPASAAGHAKGLVDRSVALRQALNKRTALGQVFFTQRSGNFRKPKLGRGCLKEIATLLEDGGRSSHSRGMK